MRRKPPADVDSTFLQYTARRRLFQTQNAIFSEFFLFFADFCVVDPKTAAFEPVKKGKNGGEAARKSVASVWTTGEEKQEKMGRRGAILRIRDVGRLFFSSRLFKMIGGTGTGASFAALIKLLINKRAKQ